MKTTLLAAALGLGAAASGLAEPRLAGFRESYRGDATLSAGADSLTGPATASFNASRKATRGRFVVDAAVRYGAEVLPLPTSFKFRRQRVSWTLGRGATAGTGRGHASIHAKAITFSVRGTFLGAPAAVTGRIQRSRRGLQVVQRISLAEGAQVLAFDLRSKHPPGDDPPEGAYERPPNPVSSQPAGAAGVISWDNAAAAIGQRLNGFRGAVRLQAVVADADEKTGAAGVFRISRSESSHELRLYFDLGGHPDPRKGSASPADYRLRDAAGYAVGNFIFLPAGVASVDLRVVPVPEGFHEVPETLILTLRAGETFALEGSGQAAVVISDASKDPANDNVFIAYLSPVAGAASSASGVSAVHLRGDNSEAVVDLTFSGLTSAQSATHISAPTSQTGAGPDIKGLPRGQLAGTPWAIAAAQYFTTDQQLLDALYAGRLSISVLSGSYPDGEIRGNYVMSSASADPPVPPDPPADGPLAGEALRRDVSRFLTQATFGPTPADLEALTADIERRGGDRIAAYAAWIDAQFALEPTRLLDYVQAADAQEWSQRETNPIDYVSGKEPGRSNRRRGWWLLAVQAPDALRQRVAFALSEIFVTSDYDEEVHNRHYGAASYYDLLARSADGNYRTLLGEVSRHPIMGQYLSFLKNQKTIVDKQGKILASPDENYAREVMQLFSIGLIALHADGRVKLGPAGGPIPLYTNADITELARVFTGWSFRQAHGAKAAGYPVVENTNFFAGGGPQYFQASWLSPMKNFPAYHDTGGKVVLGTAIPPGLTGEQDLDAALDLLAAQANTAPFFARLLIQRLVTSNPSAGYIYRVARIFADDGAGQRGNLRAVVKAILLDHEARSATAALEIGHGRQKEPLLRQVRLLRALGGASSLPLSDLSEFGYPASQLAHFPPGTTRYRYPLTDTQLAQTPLRPPTVFNWFLPAYSPPGNLAAAGLVAPEMQLTTETQVIQAINYARALTESNTGQDTTSLLNAADSTLDDVKIDRRPQVDRYAALLAAGQTPREALTAILDDLDLLLAGGSLKERYEHALAPNPRSLILDAAVASAETAGGADRVKLLTYLVANSPAGLHQP